MLKFHRFLFIGVIFTLYISSAYAQWIQMYSQAAYCFAQSGPNLFAGNYSGIILSTDDGISWTAVNNGLTELRVNSIVVNSTNIFASTWGGGVFTSTDNGTNWRAINTGLTNLYVSCLAVQDTILFAGTANFGSPPYGNVFCSTDNGENWTPTGWSSIGLRNDISSLVIGSDSVGGMNLFAGTTHGSGYIYMSSDTGVSWTYVNTTGGAVKTLEINGNNLYAGSTTGLFCSTNNGINWNSTGLITSFINDIVIGPNGTGGTNIYVGTSFARYGDYDTVRGVFLSPDSGISWLEAGLENTQVYSLALRGLNLFAGTLSGIWKLSLIGPNYAMDRDSLNFGFVSSGVSRVRSVNITNYATENSLIISNITVIPGYTVTPTPPVVIAPSTVQTFDVTFTPPTDGEVFAGEILFTHNGGSDPGRLAVAGSSSSDRVQFQVPLFFQGANPEDTSTVWIGVSGDGPGGVIPDNTYGPDLDPAYGPTGMWKEQLGGEVPPTIFWFVRLIEIPGRSGVLGLYGLFPYDFRGYNSPSQVDTFEIRVAGLHVENGPLTINWPANLTDYSDGPWTLKKKVGPNWITVADMLTSTFYTDPNPAFAEYLYYLIIKTGIKAVSPGPLFAVSPTTLNFGNVGIGIGTSFNVTVTNVGINHDLTISSVVAPPGYAVSPTSAIIEHGGGTQDFTVTFTPPGDGIHTGNIVFTHNATTGSPSLLPVTGFGTSQMGELVFTGPANIYDNSHWSGGFYTNTISLNGYVGVPLKAVQFTLRSNGKVIMHPLQKSSAVASWALSTNVVRGPELPDGSSIDEVHVVLYGTPGEELEPGSYDLLTFGYDVVNIDTDNAATTFELINIFGSTSNADNAQLNTSDIQVVTINNRTIWGDINGDDAVDLLDLLLIVDHITGKNLLTGTALDRADIAPWALPNPGDDAVNVLDLVLLQTCILTGQYPDGNPIMKLAAPVSDLAKANAAVKVELFVTQKTLEVVIINTTQIRGAHIDLTNIGEAVTNVNDESTNGVASNLKGNVLSLLFKQADVLQPGIHHVATIDLECRIPGDVRVSNLRVANRNLDWETSVAYEIHLQRMPAEYQTPERFALRQNYPNPFNPETHIEISVPQTSDVRVTIYNLLGQEVRTLFAGQMERSVKTLHWDGKDRNGRAVASGTYFYRMQAGSFVETRKMMLMK